MIRIVLGSLAGWAPGIALVPSIGLWGVALGFAFGGLGGFAAAATIR